MRNYTSKMHQDALRVRALPGPFSKGLEKVAKHRCRPIYMLPKLKFKKKL